MSDRDKQQYTRNSDVHVLCVCISLSPITGEKHDCKVINKTLTHLQKFRILNGFHAFYLNCIGTTFFFLLFYDQNQKLTNLSDTMQSKHIDSTSKT